MSDLIDKLNSIKTHLRYKALRKITQKLNTTQSITKGEVNNHVHTIYSFSPYSPTMAVYKAYKSGLKAVGIVDHDSVSGCREFLKASRIIGIASTIGFEIRVNMLNTSLEGRKINNPDSKNIIYIAVHGIPYKKISKANNFLHSIRLQRNKRNVQMVNNLNRIILKTGLEKIDFKFFSIFLSSKTLRILD